MMVWRSGLCLNGLPLPYSFICDQFFLGSPNVHRYWSAGYGRLSWNALPRPAVYAEFATIQRRNTDAELPCFFVDVTRSSLVMQSVVGLWFSWKIQIPCCAIAVAPIPLDRNCFDVHLRTPYGYVESLLTC